MGNWHAQTIGRNIGYASLCRLLKLMVARRNDSALYIKVPYASPRMFRVPVKH
jgi:hypothetical protein